MTNLSQHFALEEMVKSDYAIRHGIDNSAPLPIIDALRDLCNTTLERVRSYIGNGKPLDITSGYRSPVVNQGIGGSATSQHMKGEAADFTIRGMSNRFVVEAIMKHKSIPYDQLILEGDDSGWVHISFSKHRQRMEVLSATFETGRAVYKPFVTSSPQVLMG